MADDINTDEEFHPMDTSTDQYAEDPNLVMVRDWPPLHAVHLQYQPTGEYLGVKKGVLVLTKNPYVNSRLLRSNFLHLLLVTGVSNFKKTFNSSTTS